MDNDLQPALERAIKIAVEAHTGVKDLAGRPYILHPLSVMESLDDLDEKIVAVLHDVLEDCPGYTPEFLIELGIPKDLVKVLELLRRDPNEDYLTSYIARIAESGNFLAIRVKLADLADNMREDRPCPNRMRRMARYTAAKEILTKVLNHIIYD